MKRPKPIKKRLTKGKKCKSCKQPFDQERFGQVVCHYRYSPQCAVNYGAKLLEKEVNATAKAERRYIRTEKEKIKTLSQLKQELQPIINHIARLIDNNHGCISCGGNGKQSGGHFWAVGGHDQLRFNLLGIYGQCFHCNNHKGGAPREYLETINAVYGVKHSSYLIDEIRVKYKHLRFDRVSIQSAIKVARIERNRLKRENKTYTAKSRMDLRTEINRKIGIYL